jgi:hypothetical protein
MNARIYVLSGPRQGETVTILEPPFYVGASPEYDFYIDPEATPEATGRVIRIDLHEDGWELLNLGAGEVMVNQNVVSTRCRLRSSDVIRFSSAGPELSFSLTPADETVSAGSAVSPPATTSTPEKAEEESPPSWLAQNRILVAFVVVFCVSLLALMMLDNDQSSKRPTTFELEDQFNKTPFTVALASQTVQEGEQFTFAAGLAEIPPGVSVQYRLGPGAPDGMTVEPDGGVLSWIPSEEEGGKSHNITVIYELTKGVLQTRQRQEFALKVIEVDQPPLIAAVPHYVLDVEGDRTVRLEVEAVDPDIPSNSLIYSIVDFRVEGQAVERPKELILDRLSGSLIWKPVAADFNKTYTMRVKVAESSTASLASEREIQISLPNPVVTERGEASYLLVIEDEKGVSRFPVGNACAIRDDVLLTSGEVATLLQQRLTSGWKIAARQAVSGNTKEIVINQILVHKLFNELNGDESKQIYFDFGLLMIESQPRPVNKMASVDDWAMVAPGMPLKCMATAHVAADPLTRFDDPTAAVYPAKMLTVTPFSTDPENPLSNGTVLLQITGTLPEGCIGSPILNDAGRVLGIYAEKAEIPSDHPLASKLKNRLHYIAPGHYVTAWLKGQNVKSWTSPEIAATEPGKDKE